MLKRIFNVNIFRSFFIFFIGAILIKGISFLTTPIFTRILTPDEYGIITIFNTWVSFFAVFIGFQVSGSIASARIHRTSGNLNSYMKSIVLLSLVGAVSFLIISVFFNSLLSKVLNIDNELIPHLIVQSYGLSCATIYTLYTIQTKQPKQNLMFSVSVTLVTVVSSILLILSFESDKYIGRIYGGTFANILVVGFVLKSFVIGKTEIFSFGDWKYAIIIGSPLIIHLLANIIIGQSDRIFLKEMIGLKEAAIYSVCYNISIIGMMFAEVGNKVWSPWYLDNTKIGNNNLVNDNAKIFSIGVAFVFIVIMLISPEILALMAPSEYLVGKYTLVLVTSSVYFQFLYRFPLGYQQYRENMRWIAANTISVGIINLALNYFFINKYGLVGAAIATYISYIFLFTFHELVARKVLKNYNIKFNSYLPGLLVTTFFTIISLFLADFWYYRYALLIIIFIFIFLIYKKRNNFQYIKKLIAIIKPQLSTVKN